MKQKSKIVFLSLAFFGLCALSPELQAIDRDNNPPGPAGGPGTNWENPPGPTGGVGASPNRHYRHRYRHRHHYCKHHDCDNNPPGPAGGPGTNWENPPGPAGGPGVSPNIK